MHPIEREHGLVGLRCLAEAHYALLDANLQLRGTHVTDPLHAIAIQDLDALALLLTEGKWFLSRATGDCADFAETTASRADLDHAIACLRECADSGAEVSRWLAGSASRPGLEQHHARVSRDHEILRIGQAPIVPSICPLLMLQGEWQEMGEQYVSQCLEVFGPFVFERAASRRFEFQQEQALAAWARELQRHAPSVYEFALGMSRGGQGTRCPMTATQAIALWTGWNAPCEEAEELGVKDSVTASIMSYFGALRDPTADSRSDDLCSGFAAWGRATLDGALVAGATTDHDATFQATIIAYPARGEPFVYTPFSVNGSIPGVGYFHFAGLPGVNRRGLSYVHHGGAIGACAEPRSLWGYGLRRGASTCELLAHCASARQALDRELAWPVGDAASILGSPGGFYADAEYAYVLESRCSDAATMSPIIRTHTASPGAEPLDFLYANNNLLDPRSGGEFFPPGRGYRFESAAGWFTLDESDCRDPSPAVAGRRMWTKSSESRNRYLYEQLLQRTSHLDLQSARAIYATGPQFEFSTWSEFERRWTAGERFNGSTAHRGNAFTALIHARRDRDPEYWGCMGNAAGRAVTPNRAGHGYFYFDETYTFWRVVLKDSPESLLRQAAADAACLVAAAQRLDGSPAADRSPIRRWLAEATALLSSADARVSSQTASCAPAHVDRLSHLARNLRELTRAQVRARQVLCALAPHTEMTVDDID